MQLFKTLLIVSLGILFFQQSNAQLSTSLLPDRFNFLENGSTKSLLRFNGTDLVIDNNETNGDLFLQAANIVKVDGLQDAIILGRDRLYLSTGAGLGITRLYIDTNGEIGIGTTLPSARLEVR